MTAKAARPIARENGAAAPALTLTIAPLMGIQVRRWCIPMMSRKKHANRLCPFQ
jgi:hypothetical protein